MKLKSILPAVVLLTVFIFSGIAQADPRRDAHDRAWHVQHWPEGHWVHDRHNGQLGWWWVIGNDWHFYAHPISQPSIQTVIVPVQAQPQQVVVVQQPQTQPPAVMMAPPVQAAPAPVTPTMYYCKATETYYPQTMTCPGGWSTITAGAPPTP